MSETDRQVTGNSVPEVIYGNSEPSHAEAQVAKRSAQVAIRLCTRHNQPFIMVCTECDNIPVCTVCIDNEHSGSGHAIKIAQPIARVKKDNLEKLRKIAEEQSLPELEEREKWAKYRANQNKDGVQCVIQSIRDHGQNIKNKIDRIVDELSNTCQQIGNRNDHIYLKCEEKSKQDSMEIQNKVQESKSLIDRGNDFEIIMSKMEKEMTDMLQAVTLKPDDTLSLTLPMFFAGEVNMEQLQKIMGEVQELEDLSEEARSSKPYELAENPSEDCLFDCPIPSIIRTITPISGISAWIASDEEMKLISEKGNEEKVLEKQDVHILDVTVDKFKTVHISCNDNSIRYVQTNGSVDTRFKTDWTPESLCVSPTKELVVCLCHPETADKGKLVRYSDHGKQLAEIENDQTGKPLLTNPYRVRINNTSQDIIVVNWNPDQVLLLDKDFKLKTRYLGDRALKGSYMSHLPSEDFEPYDACFDGMNILIADLGNREILLLNSSGQYLRTLLSTSEDPRALGVDSKGRLWIGYENKVKILKYLT